MRQWMQKQAQGNVLLCDYPATAIVDERTYSCGSRKEYIVKWEASCCCFSAVPLTPPTSCRAMQRSLWVCAGLFWFCGCETSLSSAFASVRLVCHARFWKTVYGLLQRGTPVTLESASLL